MQKVKAAARTVTLSTDPGMVASALSTGSGFDLRSIKPGMLVETELDKVLPNGITVSTRHSEELPVVLRNEISPGRGWSWLHRSLLCGGHYGFPRIR